MDALDLLTEDCWIEVFRKVVSAVDLKACSETCVLFETIVNTRNPSWKLGVIIPFLVNYLNLEEELPVAVHRWEPVVEPVSFWSPALQTRLVSRTLCHAVDSYLEANLDRRCYPHRWRPTTSSYYFCCEREERIDEFLQIFETHGGNPFIGRKLTLVHFRRDINNRAGQYDDDDIQRESLYLKKVVQFLETFGHHIWTFTFQEGEHFDHHLRFCKAIGRLLNHLPNLKNLNFEDHRHIHWGPIDPLSEIHRREGLDELIPYLATHPLPALPHLETLDIRGLLSIRMGQPLVEKCAAHLKYLTMYDSRPFLQCVGRFNCLKELNMRVDPGNTLEGFRTLQSPLEKLSITIKQLNGRNPRLYDVQEFFRNVRHLPLKDLKIESDCFIGESVPISPDLQIESIRRLHIVRFTVGMSFNFLLCLTKLEKVKLSLWNSRSIISPHPSRIPETLFVREPLVDDDLYSSDIWERIPSLKKFSFSYREAPPNVGRNGHYSNSYSRGGYEKWRLNETEKFFASN